MSPIILAALAAAAVGVVAVAGRKKAAGGGDVVLTPNALALVRARIDATAAAQQRAALFRIGLARTPATDFPAMRAVFTMFQPLIEKLCPQCLRQASLAEQTGDEKAMTAALWSAIARNAISMTTVTTENPDDVIAAIALAAAQAQRLYSVSEMVTLAKGLMAVVLVQNVEPMQAELAATPRDPNSMANLLAKWGLRKSFPSEDTIVIDTNTDARGEFYWDMFTSDDD